MLSLVATLLSLLCYFLQTYLKTKVWIKKKDGTTSKRSEKIPVLEIQ